MRGLGVGGGGGETTSSRRLAVSAKPFLFRALEERHFQL